MKKTVAWLALSLAALPCTNAQVLNIAEAVKKGLVAITAKGAGGHSGECLQLEFKNLTKKKLKLVVPSGQVFEPADSGLQNLMVSKDDTLLVEAGALKRRNIFGFCVEAGDGSPGQGSAFAMGRMAEGNLLKLARHLSANSLHQHPNAQYAVWAVSDADRLEGIGDPGLAKFVADLLGKPVPQYNIVYQSPPQDRLLPGQPANWREALAMNGLFYYDLAADQSVDFGLYNEAGELVHALFKNRLQKRGHHKFRFEFEIRGLEKGKYFARMTSRGAVIKELAVEF